MNDAYYENGRKWYNTMFVDCASERFSYLLILVLAGVCFWRAFIIIDSVKASKAANCTIFAAALAAVSQMPNNVEPINALSF